MKISSDLKKNSIWGLFACIAFIEILRIAGIVLDLGWTQSSILFYLEFILLVTCLVLHAVSTLTMRRAFVFILIMSSVTLILDIISLHYGIFSGEHLTYGGHAGFTLLGLPILMPFFWAAYIYAGYTIVNSFLHWTYNSKPQKKEGGLAALILLIILDGLVVVAADLFIDPLQLNPIKWVWPKGGPFFGIPIANYISWFKTVVICTGIFRVFEYFCPIKPVKIDESLYLLPMVGYGLLCLKFVFYALNAQLPELAMIGFFAMMPIVVVNLLLYAVSKRRCRAKYEAKNC